MSRKHLKPSHLELINQRGREPIQPPRLLGHIRKTSLGHGEQLLAHLFSATDDLFYDLSKRASSNNEQNLYFEAMREIRIKREGIAKKFLSSVNALFSDLIDTHNNGDFESWDEDTPTANRLSIVEGDDLEVDLARSNMVSRTRDIYREELYELATRLDHLLLQVEISEDNNPLDPSQVTKAFIDACQTSLEINIKAKLILYKLFEKHVLKQLGHIYADANQILLEAGILPKVPKSLDGRITRSGQRNRETDAVDSRRQHHHLDGNAPFAPQPNQTPEFRMGYDALGLLMAAARNLALARQADGQATTQNVVNPSTTAQPMHANHTASRMNRFNCYIYTNNPGPVMAAPELTALLTQTQPVFDQKLASAGEPRNVIADVVGQLLGQKSPGKPQSLEQNEENIINLVAMFFDQILADEALPVEIQSLLCRLQIPILKVALRDKSFFSNPDHPARKLINRITEIGIGFDNSKPLERDPLFRKIIDIVQAINRQYKADDNIFAELQTQLNTVAERESKKSSIVEQRTTQTESGKSRIKHARNAAQSALYSKLKNVDLPEVVRDFLTAHWLQVMIITYLKQGAESTEWISNEQTVTDIIWMCQEHTDARSLQRRERLMPELLDRIEKELEVAIDNQDLRAVKVITLEDALKRLPVAPEVQESIAPLTETQKEALGKGQDAPKSWEEMSAVERQQARYEELSAHYFEMAKSMPEGAWLDYIDENQNKSVRCKLASKIDADTYIFVNRLGFKVLERTRKQFAYDMQFARAKNIDTRPFFDRIMGKVVENIEPPNVPASEVRSKPTNGPIP